MVTGACEGVVGGWPHIAALAVGQQLCGYYGGAAAIVLTPNFACAAAGSTGPHVYLPSGCVAHGSQAWKGGSIFVATGPKMHPSVIASFTRGEMRGGTHRIAGPASDISILYIPRI